MKGQRYVFSAKPTHGFQHIHEPVFLDLQNDLKNLMERIEEGIHKIHAGSVSVPPIQDEPMEPEREPFAIITIVSPGSPADICVSFMIVLS